MSLVSDRCKVCSKVVSLGDFSVTDKETGRLVHFTCVASISPNAKKKIDAEKANNARMQEIFEEVESKELEIEDLEDEIRTLRNQIDELHEEYEQLEQESFELKKEGEYV